MPSIKKKKVILSICDLSPLKMGSFEEFLIEMTKKLTIEGIEHKIVFRESPISSVEEALKNAGATVEVIVPSKVNIINFYIFYCLIKRVQPNIVHFHFYPIYTVVNYLKNIFNIKLVYTDHMGGRKAETTIKKVLRKTYYNLNYILYGSFIDEVIYVSNFVKSKYAIEYGINNKNSCVIYNGVNIEKYSKFCTNPLKSKYGLKDELIVTCVGLRKDKGPHYLLRAAPIVLKELSDVKFLFVGEGDCRFKLESIASDLDIVDNVIFAGKVTNLSDVYNISSLVIIPSLFEEAFCFVAVEAMAAGTPVIAFNSGAIKEVLYDQKYIIPKDYNLLATKIIETLNSNINCMIFQDYVVEHFPLEKTIYEHFALYNRLIISTHK